MSLATTAPAPAGADVATPAAARPFTVRSFGLTDRGRVRPSNEDHFAVVELTRGLRVHHTSVPQAKAQSSSHRGYLFVVADGMGGHQGGATASRMAVEYLRNELAEVRGNFDAALLAQVHGHLHGSVRSLASRAPARRSSSRPRTRAVSRWRSLSA